MNTQHTTHSYCNKRLNQKGGKAKCCWCFPHSHCEFMKPKQKEIPCKEGHKNRKGCPHLCAECAGISDIVKLQENCPFCKPKQNKEINIGMLRQWLNEDRITDPKKMVTNEDIKHWLQWDFGGEKQNNDIEEMEKRKHHKSVFDNEQELLQINNYQYNK